MAVDVLANTIDPLVQLIQPFFLRLSVIFGGIFGLYIILILVRVYYERKKVKLMEAMRYNSDQWNEHNGVPNSKMKRSTLRKFSRYVKNKVMRNDKNEILASPPEKESNLKLHPKTKKKSSKK